MNYKIIGKNNEEYGPYPIEKLQGFANMGKLRPNMCLVDSDGRKYLAKDIIQSLNNIQVHNSVQNNVYNNSQDTVDLTYLSNESPNRIEAYSRQNTVDLTNDYSENTTIKYSMIGGDGRVYGPYTIEELQRFVYENRVAPNSVLTDTHGGTHSAREILNFPNNSFNNSFSSSLNDSGMGTGAVLPHELRGLNWGAFFFPIFWGISHNTWLALITLIVPIGWIMNIILLFKGNEWAWQNRRWNSYQQFRDVQKTWTNWALAYIGICFFIGVISGLVS